MKKLPDLIIAILFLIGAGAAMILTAMIFIDSGKTIESIPMYSDETKIVHSPIELKWAYDVTANRTITLPDRDMDWPELLWEAYQQGYDQGVKDSTNHQPKK